MTNTARGILLTALMMAFSAASTQAQELHIRCRLSEEGVRQKHSAPSSRPSTQPEMEKLKAETDATIGLGKSYFFVEKDQTRTIYDFRSCRRITLDLRDRTYVDDSLYSQPAFNINEFENRIALAHFLHDVVKDSDKPGGRERLFDLETIFGVEVADARGPKLREYAKALTNDKLVSDERSGNVLFRCGKDTVVQYSLAGHALDSQQAALYGAFLLYECHVHPQIRSKIVSGRSVPNSVAYSFQNYADKATVTYLLKSVEKADVDNSGIPRGYIPALPVDPSGAALDLVLRKSRSAKPVGEEEVVAFITERSEKGESLDAFLALMEFRLQTGQAPKKLSPQAVKAAINNEQVKAFGELLGNVDSAEKAKEVVRQLDDLKAKAPQKSYILDVFRANNLVSLDERDQAEKLFLGVLGRNPNIAGVYKDLGEIYYRNYRTDLAWRCWDRAREIAPDHPLLRSIVLMEKQMRKGLPQYFPVTPGNGKALPGTSQPASSQSILR